MVPVERIELPPFGLQNRCSTAELNRQAVETIKNFFAIYSQLRSLLPFCYRIPLERASLWWLVVSRQPFLESARMLRTMETKSNGCNRQVPARS
jgi:hypothetical protein